MRRALITGGSGALGSAICRRIAEDGCHVIVHGNTGLDRAEAVAAEIRDGGGSAESRQFDVTDGQATESVLAEVLAEAPVQIVVSNAGIFDDAPLAGMSAKQWSSVIDVSLNGFYNVVKPLLLPMIGTRWGRIVAISSVSGVMGNRGQANYAAAKAGLHGAIKSIALEYASRGVTANAVAPGIIDTPDVSSRIPDEKIASLVPMKRAGRPQEVADLVGFLASEQAGYITGQVISINGGIA